MIRAKTTPPSFLDVALFPFVRQFANVDRARFDSLGLRQLGDWLDHLVAHPLFLSVMSKYPLWQPDLPKIEFHPEVVVQA